MPTPSKRSYSARMASCFSSSADRAAAFGRQACGPRQAQSGGRNCLALPHLAGVGPTIFDHVCRMGLEGIVSKRTDAPYRSGEPVR